MSGLLLICFNVNIVLSLPLAYSTIFTTHFPLSITQKIKMTEWVVYHMSNMVLHFQVCVGAIFVIESLHFLFTNHQIPNFQ